MKRTMLLLFITLTNFIWAQTTAHKAIPGTKCSLVPPAGFVAATAFSGFQNNSLGASIMVIEMPGPFAEVSKGFNADLMLTNGMTLLDKQVIDFNGEKAMFINVSQPARGTIFLKQMLVFGDENKTVLVNGIYPEANKDDLAEEIKKALLSTLYNEKQTENPLSATHFMVDVSGTHLKFAKYIGGMLIYSTDGRIPMNKPSLIVGPSLGSEIIPDQKQFSIDRLKKLPRGESNRIKEITAIQLDGLPGYEIVAEGENKDGKTELTYQVMLFEEKGSYFIIIGKTSEELEKYLHVFRRIAKTFKRK